MNVKGKSLHGSSQTFKTTYPFLYESSAGGAFGAGRRGFLMMPAETCIIVYEQQWPEGPAAVARS